VIRAVWISAPDPEVRAHLGDRPLGGMGGGGDGIVVERGHEGGEPVDRGSEGVQRSGHLVAR
jgi:hypothetical protein